MNAYALVGLSIVGALSPLLTFAAFWQVKEWRWDRLREHTRREGWWLLIGKSRAAILAIDMIALVSFSASTTVTTAALWAFAILTLGQCILRRQPHPTWTSKAMTLTGTATVLSVLTGIVLARASLFPLLAAIPIAQPLFLLCAWAAFLPVDRLLKRRSLARAAALRSRYSDLRVIGITGSVGKTTTKELLAHILKPLSPLCTPAHVNTEMGVARWLMRALVTPPAPGTPLIVEMGAYRRHEIETLCDIVQPVYGVITYIGSQHLALFGSPEALMQAKGELFAALPPRGHAFLNGDCARCEAVAANAHCPITIVGTGGQVDLRATDIEELSDGLRFRLGETSFHVPLHGTHNVSNVLLAIAVAQSLGLSLASIAASLRSFSPLHRTFEVREECGIRILDDTHNASAASFRAAIAWADAQPFEHKTLLTSGLIELGEEHAQTHRELGMLAADVFENVIFSSTTGASFFADGYGRAVHTPSSTRIPQGSLLVCVGRMPPSTIRKLLPCT